MNMTASSEVSFFGEQQSVEKRLRTDISYKLGSILYRGHENLHYDVVERQRAAVDLQVFTGDAALPDILF